MPPTQRLRRLQGHIGGARAEPAAGVLKWLQGLLGGGDDEAAGEEGHGHAHSHGDGGHAHSHGDEDHGDAEPAVSGTVRACFVAPDDEELAATFEGGVIPDDKHFIRHTVDSITVDSADLASYPPSHQGFAQTLDDPNERSLLCTTAEGYAKLRQGLPQYAEHFGPERPGSGEQLHVDGLEQWTMCLGDVYEVAGRGTKLEVSSPRRPCDKWNMTHNENDPTHRYDHPEDQPEGNIRHYCLTQTLGGVFFRILEGGEICTGDTITLVERPYPDCAPHPAAAALSACPRQGAEAVAVAVRLHRDAQAARRPPLLRSRRAPGDLLQRRQLDRQRR